MLMNSSMPLSIREGEWKSNLLHDCSVLTLKAVAMMWQRAPPGLRSSKRATGSLVRAGLLTCLPNAS